MKKSDPFAAIVAALGQPGTASSDFDLNRKSATPPQRGLRAAAVLVPLIEIGGRVEVILTKRASGLEHHPGQIAFPGGKRDAADSDLCATARREAKEEIGLSPDNVEVLGQLPPHVTVTGFRVSPIVGRIRDVFDPVSEQGEVAEIFRVPLSHVLDPANYSVESRLWLGERRYFYTVPYGPYYIWGATARMLRGLAERMAN